MRFRIALGAVLLMAAVLLSGCNGSRENDEVSYGLAIGIDAAPDGKLQISYRVAVPRTLAGSGEGVGGGGEKSSELITITAVSLAEARNLLSTHLARSITLSHNKAFVFGEELARKGLGDIIGPLLRFQEFRGSMFIAVARGTAQEAMRENKPTQQVLPSRWIEGVLFEANDAGYALPTTVHGFYKRLKSVTGAPFVVYTGVDPETGEGRSGGTKIPGEKAEEYLAGDIPKKGDTPVSVAGTAVFRGDKMVGVLTNEETRMLAILINDFPRGFISVEDPMDSKSSVNINLRNGRQPKLDTKLADGRAIIDVDVLLEGEVTSISSGINYESAQYKQVLEAHIAEIVRQQMARMIAHTQQLNSDVVNFGQRLAPTFGTYREYSQIRWSELYPQAEVHVKVAVKIRRNGLMWQTKPIREKAHKG